MEGQGSDPTADVAAEKQAGRERRTIGLLFAAASAVIVAFLAALVFALWVWRSTSAHDEEIYGARSEVCMWCVALRAYAEAHDNKYPSELGELLVPDEHGEFWMAGEGVLEDPWGNEYLYDPPVAGRGVPVVYTYGADGVEGGKGANADISSTDIFEEGI